MDKKQEEKEKLPVLSYSKMVTFKRCPKSYKFIYIDKLPKEEKPYNIFGKFCHDVLESFHKYFLTNIIEKEKFASIMAKAFKENRKKHAAMTREQLDEAYELIKKYLKYISSKTDNFPNVISLEEKIWETVDDKFIFYGFIDRLQRDSDGLFHIVDYKTTANKAYLKDDTQIKLYAYFVSLKNKEADKLRTSYILLKHNSSFMTKEYSIQDLVKTKNKFVESWHQLEQEKLFRAVPGYQNCTICDHVSHCHEGSELMERKKGFYGKENAW